MPAESVMVALTLVCRAILGVVFVRSAWGKFADVAGFARGLAAYQLLPARLIAPLAWLLPLLELALAATFLLGLMLPIAGGIGALLLAVFIAAIVINLRRGRSIACNCHGSAQQTPISWGLVVRDGLLLPLTLVLVFVAPLVIAPTQLALYWQGELALLFSWAALPVVMLLGCFVVCSLLITTMIDVRSAVQQVHSETSS